jgi:cysteine desulfurase
VRVANNELGSLQPVAELAEISHVNGAYFHTDAAQMLGKLPFDLEEINCDFVSFSAHKMYGPKGIGALFVRGGVQNWPWARPFGGGGQEMGLRPGTSNVPAIVGFGEACRMARLTMDNRISTLRGLTEEFINGLNEYAIDATTINDTTNSIPGTISLLIHGVPSDILIAHCTTINISKGSACNNGVTGPSYVLSEVLHDISQLDSVVRVSLGVHSLAEDFPVFFELISEIKKKVGNHE